MLCRSFSFQRVGNGPAIAPGGGKCLSKASFRPPGSTLHSTSSCAQTVNNNRGGNWGKSSLGNSKEPLASSCTTVGGSSSWSTRETVTGGGRSVAGGRTVSKQLPGALPLPLPPRPPHHSISPPVAMVAPVLATTTSNSHTSGHVTYTAPVATD